MPKKKRKKNYSPRQIAYYIRITKNPERLKYWQEEKEKTKQRIVRTVDKITKRIPQYKQEKARQKAEKEKERLMKEARKQGIDLEMKISGTYGERNLEEEKRRSRRKIEQKLKESKNILDYLKENTISQTRRNYDLFQDDPKQIYSTLLDNAMLNPVEFKEEIIQQMDKLKNLLEIEMIIWGEYKGQTIETAKVVTRGKTIEEFQQILEEYGIRPNTILTSEQFKHFVQALDSGNWGMSEPDTRILDIGFEIRLMRGN